jgi:hypothetical protein
MRTLACCLLLAAPALAQIEFADGKLWVTGQERLRLEYRVNNVTFNSANPDDTDLWLLQRARLGLGARPLEWLKLYGELQDAREIGSERVPLNVNLEEDTIDWRQGWFELAHYKEFPLGLKVGRQELSYGDERLIGAFDWNNVGRVFDAIKVRYQADRFWVDAFGANVVNNNVLSGRDNSFDDKADWADDFYGLYGRTTMLTNHVWDLYALYRDKADAKFLGAKRQIYTLGTRFEATPALAPWDYFVEFAGQFGHVQTPGGQFGETAAGWSDHRALAGVVSTGYTFDHEWKPRLGIEYSYASGDGNPRDRTDETFDNLFPTNHKFYGYMDLFAWKNLHNPRLTLSCQPHKTVKVQFDAHGFWLDDNQDAWYRANGNPIRRDPTGHSASFVGSELDLTVNYTPHKRLKLQAGYSRFFTGDFVRNTGKASDADFVYTQLSLSL